MTYPYIRAAEPAPTLLQRLARAIWTRQCAREFERRLHAINDNESTSASWSRAQCRELAEAVADANVEHGNTYGWLFGKLRTTPADAVDAELECWEE